LILESSVPVRREFVDIFVHSVAAVVVQWLGLCLPNRAVLGTLLILVYVTSPNSIHL
jgi:hypothetical protein